MISYNRADKAWAEWIAWQLEDAGYTTLILQGLDPGDEASPEFDLQLLGQVMQVQVLLVDRTQGSAQVGRQRGGRRLVLGDEPVGLNVEDKARGRALRPEDGVARGGERIVAAVDLDHREVFGVEPKPLLGRPDLRRIEPARFDQVLVRPGRGADEDRGHGAGGARGGLRVYPRHTNRSVMPRPDGAAEEWTGSDRCEIGRLLPAR